MAYFVTGATGSIGKRLVERLLEKRQGKIYVLVRESSKGRLDELIERWTMVVGPSAAERIEAVFGDLRRPLLGIEKEQVIELRGKINHFFHLAAVYDMTAPAERNTAVNVGGTTHAVELARALDAKHLHHVSSIAVAGEYKGVFDEEMFDEGQKLPSPYHLTKFESERIAREQPYVPWRVYRPGIVVGDSRTGEMDKIDGPYYFFKAIERMRHLLPEWVPLVGLDLGYTNIVPVDWVAGALEHIAHEPDLDGHAFHLTDPRPQRVDDLLNELATAAHAPRFAVSIDKRLVAPLPKWPLALAAALPPFRQVRGLALRELGIPKEVIAHLELVPRFDTRQAAEALAGSPLETPPPLPEYVSRLWDYWEREMNTDLGRGRSLKEALNGKHVMITGASSGIGRRAAADRAQRRQARGGPRRDRRRRRHRLRLRGRHLRHVVDRAAARAGARRSPQRGHAHQQRRALDPALGRAQLRPLPRLRTHDPAQLLRRCEAATRAAAAHARAWRRAHRQRVLDRRADEPAAVLRLRRLQGRARRLQPRGRLRGRRRRRDVHDDPHAARAHADDRAHEDVRRVPRDQPGGGRGHDLRGDAQPAQADGHAHRQVRRSRLLAEPQRGRPPAAPRLPRVPGLRRIQGPARDRGARLLRADRDGDADEGRALVRQGRAVLG